VAAPFSDRSRATFHRDVLIEFRARGFSWDKNSLERVGIDWVDRFCQLVRTANGENHESLDFWVQTPSHFRKRSKNTRYGFFWLSTRTSLPDVLTCRACGPLGFWREPLNRSQCVHSVDSPQGRHALYNARNRGCRVPSASTR
jgi:hypothetical protein